MTCCRRLCIPRVYIKAPLSSLGSDVIVVTIHVSSSIALTTCCGNHLILSFLIHLCVVVRGCWWEVPASILDWLRWIAINKHTNSGFFLAQWKSFTLRRSSQLHSLRGLVVWPHSHLQWELPAVELVIGSPPALSPSRSFSLFRTLYTGRVTPRPLVPRLFCLIWSTCSTVWLLAKSPKHIWLLAKSPNPNRTTSSTKY